MPDGRAERDSAVSESRPCAFVSYSWTSPEHQARIKEWADQLLLDGIDVKLDIYDLSEGNDKFAYMESMVTDPAVSHVLVFSDAEYARKANDRRGGVGTESQIISREVYNEVEQTKFIPIVCEFDGTGDQREPCLPVFMKSLVWFDFSTPERAHGSWERLIRLLHGSPNHVRPPLGPRPTYIDEHDDANRRWDKLSVDEQQVVGTFVLAGGCVLSWDQMNEASVSTNAVESLVARGLLWTSVTADGSGETFVLDPDLFDTGQLRWEPPF